MPRLTVPVIPGNGAPPWVPAPSHGGAGAQLWPAVLLLPSCGSPRASPLWLADASSRSQLLWSPMPPPPSALRPGAAETMQELADGECGDPQPPTAAMDEGYAADAAAESPHEAAARQPQPSMQPSTAAADEEDEAGDAGDADSTMAEASPKRPRSPTSASVVKRPKWRSPAVASSSGQGESQQSVPSPAVGDSPMVERVQVGAEAAMWAVTESLFVALFDLSTRLPAGEMERGTGAWGEEQLAGEHMGSSTVRIRTLSNIHVPYNHTTSTSLLGSQGKAPKRCSA